MVRGQVNNAATVTDSVTSASERSNFAGQTTLIPLKDRQGTQSFRAGLLEVYDSVGFAASAEAGGSLEAQGQTVVPTNSTADIS